MKISGRKKGLCAFCRTPTTYEQEEEYKRLKNLMEKGNGEAFCTLGGCYAIGELGLPQDMKKASELWLKAGELGCSDGYTNLSSAFIQGTGVERDSDMKKAKYYYELAAMGGNISARFNVGCLEEEAGNDRRAFKHFILAAKAGHKKALNEVTSGFMNGYIKKDEYANILRAHHERQKEMKSDARDKAAASGIFSLVTA